jgi:DNA-binding XRE family transcriptional regulator
LRSTTQAVTNRHLIEFKVWSDIPSTLLAEVRSQLSPWTPSEDDDELVDWFSTDLHKQIEARMTPGSWLRELRDAHGWTQKDLGIRLGDVSPARISDWENNHRSMSKDVAKQLSDLFRVSVERFL